MTEPRKTPIQFRIEERAGVHVVVFANGGCRPATDTEIVMCVDARELAEAALELLTATSLLRLLVKSHRPALAECGDFKRNTEAMRQMESALARHRAKQEVQS